MTQGQAILSNCTQHDILQHWQGRGPSRHIPGCPSHYQDISWQLVGSLQWQPSGRMPHSTKSACIMSLKIGGAPEFVEIEDPLCVSRGTEHSRPGTVRSGEPASASKTSQHKACSCPWQVPNCALANVTCSKSHSRLGPTQLRVEKTQARALNCFCGVRFLVSFVCSKRICISEMFRPCFRQKVPSCLGPASFVNCS